MPTARAHLPAGLLLALTLLAGGCSTGEPAAEEPTPSAPTGEPSDSTDASPSPSTEEDPSSSASEQPEEPASERARPAPPISVPGLAEQRHRGDRLRLGAVREQTAGYTSYDVTYRSRSTTGADRRGEESYTISGVLNVPTGRGPFPAVVLAHGYIDPAIYVRGQGMTRERGYLASRGYIALHVDYRNHAESTDDPRIETAVRLGYATDVIAAANALARSDDVRVDPDRIGLFGRSMGGGVMLKALAIDPGVFAAGVGWASVSSLEGQNFDHFQRPDAPVAELRAGFRGRHGLPDEDPRFWRGVSPRPVFDDITEPVLMVHGRFDDTCPPPWARATQRALTTAGVDSTLEWYDDGHAFGPAFIAAMDRTVRFLDARMTA